MKNLKINDLFNKDLRKKLRQDPSTSIIDNYYDNNSNNIELNSNIELKVLTSTKDKVYIVFPHTGHINIEEIRAGVQASTAGSAGSGSTAGTVSTFSTTAPVTVGCSIGTASTAGTVGTAGSVDLINL